MKFFLDTEFIERGSEFPLILLSIGIVAEDGREFYAENIMADHATASDWVKQNVIVHLGKPGTLAGTPKFIAAMILKFIGDEKPEFWGYYADYDWVAVAQMFGTMMDLPKGWPMYCRDIKQWCDEMGNPALPEQGKGEHNALADARWNKVAWQFLHDRLSGASTAPETP